MDIDEIRRTNIRAIERELGSPTAVAEAVGMSYAQYQNLRDGAKDPRSGKKRGMRKETAWRFEDAGNKPRGWLDQDHGAGIDQAVVDQPSKTLQYQAKPSAPPATSFEDALRVVAMALGQADKSDRNAAKAYLVDLCDRPGEVDTFAAKLTRLLTPLPRQANGTNH